MRLLHLLPLVLLFPVPNVVAGRKLNNETISLSLSNNNTAYPFGKFKELIAGIYHPGIETGYSFDWVSRKRHDWFQDTRAGYMFHRFVQHGIPLYTQLGYRYKFNPHIRAYTSIGAGYFHSIPATAVLKLDDNGDYQKSKGIGRPQMMFCFELGAGYFINPGAVHAFEVFINYQQRFQAPFVRSYVPLLPYNILQIGVRKTIHRRLLLSKPTQP